MQYMEYVYFESKRQSATLDETKGMMTACKDAAERFSNLESISELMLIDWANMINPNLTDYRRTPVTFRNGGHAANAENIPRLMSNLVKGISEDLHSDADYWTKKFLIIHPFSDGNGRVGSLLWNYLRKSIHDPEIMPYFFGEK